MRVLVILVLAAKGLSGCVSSNRIQTIQVGDTNKSCEVLSAELGQLGVQFQDAKDDSGITGKNVGMAIFFGRAL
jgi:outer membrane murein-binding lipoprotein Lpp